MKAQFTEDHDTISTQKWKLLASFPFTKGKEREKLMEFIERTFWLDTFSWDHKNLKED